MSVTSPIRPPDNKFREADDAADAGRYFRKLAWYCLGLALLVGVSPLFGAAEWAPWMGAIFALLGLHGLTAASSMRQIAHLRSALTMKRIAIDMMQPDTPLVGMELALCAGETEELRARDGSRFRFRLVGASHARAMIKVEYLG